MMFLFIVAVNVIFVLRWFFVVLDAAILSYQTQIFRFCPCLINYVAILQKTFQETFFSYNVVRYTFSFMRISLKNKRDFILIKV